ncbi:MAG: hypothetical protein ACHQT8_02670 [Chlamydiales bacterium]
MHRVAAHQVQEIPRFAFNAPWAEGFDTDVFMRTVGLVIIVVVGILYGLSLLFKYLGFDAAQPERQAGAGIRLPAGDGVVNRPANRQPVSAAARQLDEAAVRTAAAATHGLIINQKEISAAPPAIEDIINLLDEDVSQVRVDQILDQYDQVFESELRAVNLFIAGHIRENCKDYGFLPDYRKERAHYYAREAASRSGQTRAVELLQLKDRPLRNNYVEFIKARSTWGSCTPEYFNRIELVAKHIICQLRKPHVPLHKKQVALSQIADAAAHGCPPRRLEESQRQLLFLLGRTLTVKDRCLLFAQALKEDLLLQHFQGEENFHVINRMRRHIGREWGLSQDPLSLNDPHAKDGGMYAGNATPDQMRAVLRENYTAPRLVSAIHTRLAYDNDLVELCDYLNATLQGDERDNIANLDHPEEGYTAATTMQIDGEVRHISVVTLKGVAKIAQMVGLLTPQGR